MVNRLRVAWKALGRVRRLALLVLLFLTATQTILLVIFAQPLFLPTVWMISIVGLILIKQSAVTRDMGSRMISIRRQTTAMSHSLNVLKRRMSALEARFRELSSKFVRERWLPRTSG